MQIIYNQDSRFGLSPHDMGFVAELVGVLANFLSGYPELRIKRAEISYCENPPHKKSIDSRVVKIILIQSDRGRTFFVEIDVRDSSGTLLRLRAIKDHVQEIISSIESGISGRIKDEGELVRRLSEDRKKFNGKWGIE